MQELCTNTIFLFISNLYGWDSGYQQHIVDCYSNYSDTDSALSAICADYNLDLSTISNSVGESVVPVNPVCHVMDDEICNRILSIILRSQCAEVKRVTRLYHDMSCYKLMYDKDNLYKLTYKNYEQGYTAELASVSVELNCIVKSWRNEQLRRKADKLVGWVNLYDKDAIIYFNVNFNK